MVSKRDKFCQRKSTAASFRLSVALAVACLIVPVGTALAQRVWEKDKGNKSAADAKKANAADEAKGVKARTQGGARVTFTSLKDWNLKGEDLSARGHNPLYFPLKPGFRYIMEYPEHPWGHLWIEVVVLDKTEKFDVPGIGKFECAVVQEEEFYDGVLDQRAENWFCIDKKTNAMYAMGEVSWEIDQIGRKVFEGTWRIGEPDGHGVAEPGMLMPGKFKIGDKYIFDGHEAEAYGYTENMETGVTVVTPAGTFKDCVRTREFSLTNPSDVTDKFWCKGIGMVRDTSDGWLYASDAVPGSDIKSFGKFYKTPGKQTVAPVAKVDGLKATEIALKKVPGKANSLKIVRMGKRNVYQVEIIAEKNGEETDVFVDIETGEVAGTDN